MDPLTPTTSTLSPAISHIAETAKSLAGSLQGRSVSSSAGNGTGNSSSIKRRKQQETVRWVLATPSRLQAMIEDGEIEEAKSDWAEVENLLQQWDGVVGVTDLRNACLKILGSVPPDEAS